LISTFEHSIGTLRSVERLTNKGHNIHLPVILKEVKNRQMLIRCLLQYLFPECSQCQDFQILHFVQNDTSTWYSFPYLQDTPLRMTGKRSTVLADCRLPTTFCLLPTSPGRSRGDTPLPRSGMVLPVSPSGAYRCRRWLGPGRRSCHAWVGSTRKPRPPMTCRLPEA